MEATTRKRGARAVSDRELALRLGTLMLHCLGGRGGDVLRVIDESGLTFVQMKTVVTLQGSGEDEPTTVTALAESMGISAASASRAVDGLVRKRLVTRGEDPDDRRVRRVGLTAKGSELADQIISARLAGLEEFAASLEGAERDKLADALATLIEREDFAELHDRNALRATARKEASR
jgi:DNA-binding MarR family transcriptional regulator